MKKAIRSIVKSEVSKNTETKRAAFYQSYNDGTSTARAVGTFAAAGWAVQNNAIAINNTDILQLIPFIARGTDSHTRVGMQIVPKSLTVSGSIRLVLNSRIDVLAPPPTHLTVCLFVLQHVNLKMYDQLYSTNDFSTLFDTDQGSSALFRGAPNDPKMRIQSANYRLLAKKLITLRFAGTLTPTGTPLIAGQASGFSADHTWYSNYRLNLTKHLPAKLNYPEEATQAGPLPVTQIQTPTNSSIFMCMGFVDWYNASTGQPSSQAYIEQTYVSHLSFKDA